jgi:CheY-like chemotaxis protein
MALQSNGVPGGAGKLPIICLPFFRRIPHTKPVVMALSLPAKKILVVDDDPVVLKALFLALRSRGYEMFAAFDGPEAFSIARQERPDLILLDIFFPPDAAESGNTWDAFLIIDWLQRSSVGYGIPIIIISVAEPGEFRERCLAAGAAGYFQKPINLPELLDAIQQIFRPRVSNVPVELPAMSNSDRLRL